MVSDGTDKTCWVPMCSLQLSTPPSPQTSLSAVFCRKKHCPNNFACL